jgi:hypothetical protein
MLRPRSLRKVVVTLGGAAMLVVQVAMAAQACMLQPASDAPAQASVPHEDPEQAPCHEMDGSAPQSHCAQRCDVAKQAPDHQPVSFTPVLGAIHPVAPPARRAVTGYVPTEPQALLARATAPPLSVRNCCFRT